MSGMSFLLSFLFLYALCGVDAITNEYIDKIIAQGPYSADWKDIAAKYTPPQWYIDAKFGFYTHWLISSVPAFGSEWYPRNMYVPGSSENEHQVKTYGPLSPTNGFKEFIPAFDGKFFDPNDWMDLFQKAGGKYAGPVGEHHDGFPMFNCSLTPYNAVAMGPKRDIAALLLASSKKLPQKMYFILSSHRAWHFAFYNNGRKWPNSDVNQCACPSWQSSVNSSTDVDLPQADPFYCNLYCPANPNEVTPTDAFMKDWLLRTCEMADLYTPDVLYFDWWIGVSPLWQPYLQKMAAFYYNRLVQDGKVGVINTKGTTMPVGTDVLDFERGQACAIQTRYWQTDTSISTRSWGYITNDEYKSPASLIDALVDIVSKNGGMLLNVGPPPNGTIPADARTSLLSVGAWLSVTGDAIYGTRPYHVFSEGPTQLGCGSFSDGSLNFTQNDFRFTVNPTKSVLYIVCMGANLGTEILVKSLGSGRLGSGTVTGVQVLGYSGQLAWSVDGTGLRVTLPQKLPFPAGLPPVVGVFGLRDLVWDGIVRQGQDSSIVLYASSAAELSGGVELNVAGDYVSAAKWDSTSSSISWNVQVTRSGNYFVTVLAASPSAARSGKLTVLGKSVEVQLEKTDSATDYHLSPNYAVTISAGASVQFTFQTIDKEEHIHGVRASGLQIAYVQLTPTK